MKISAITLHNFRIYKGTNTISFTPFSEKNIHIIAGKNGYGKTTFLTSLIWGFYGKLIGQVEDKYRRDIKNSGGYASYVDSLINREVKYSFEKKENTKDHHFFVEIELTDLQIPSFPCDTVIIKRSYNVVSKEENLQILIDGIENELTKEVGYELFINDFILPREIAKFFFFDAEKIVSLAEAKSKEELRTLSKAYSEVLGIKKYEELKKNLTSLLTKLNRKGVSDSDRKKLTSLENKERELRELFEENLEEQQEIKTQIVNLQLKSDELQEKLIREGNAITLEQLKELKERKKILKEESTEIKKTLNKLLEIVPLVISGKKLTELKNQLDKEQDYSSTSKEVIEQELKQFSNKLLKRFVEAGIANKKIINEILKNSIKEKISSNNSNKKIDILLDVSVEQYRNFNAIYTNIKGVFVDQFNNIVQQEKNNRVLLSKTINKIKQAEARKDNHLAKKIRTRKEENDTTITELENKLKRLFIEQGKLENKHNASLAKLNEFDKEYSFLEADEKKYRVTEKLLEKITALITKIKEEKKYTLQKALKLSLNKLMHKENFISDVKVTISNDLINIDLVDKNGGIINKDTLSKGEQQLYATSLLKALVDESGIQFPVFIDSPLQKFDKYHSANIIQEFYPTISKQVVLLPLLEKELTEKEYQLLRPNIDKSFIIKSNNENISTIKPSDINKEFLKLKAEKENDVYTD